MDFIPIEPTDDLHSLIDSASNFPLSLENVYYPGDYERESIEFIANEDIESLNDYMLVYSVENQETGLPIYSKCRLLTFDEIELPKGDRLKIYTRCGEDSTTMDVERSAFCNLIYWGLPDAIWHIPHSSFELIKLSDSYSGVPRL